MHRASICPKTSAGHCNVINIRLDLLVHSGRVTGVVLCSALDDAPAVETVSWVARCLLACWLTAALHLLSAPNRWAQKQTCRLQRAYRPNVCKEKSKVGNCCEVKRRSRGFPSSV